VEYGTRAFRATLADVGTFTRLDQDLIVNGRVLEVKARDVYFTTPQDYPYSTVLLDTVDGYNAKAEKPHGYVIVSALTGAMLYTPSNPEVWVQAMQPDPERNIRYLAYFAPKARVTPLGAVAFRVHES
jgi:hypothetical protein